MELDNLKQQMNRQLEDDSSWQPTEDIKSIIGKQSASIVQKIRRSLWMESFIGVFVNIPMTIFLGYQFPKLLEMKLVWIVFFLILATPPFLGYLIAQTYKFERQTTSIRENLLHIHHLINRYCQINIVLIILSIPIGYAIGFYLSMPFDAISSIGDIVTYFYQLPDVEKFILSGVLIFLELLFLWLMRWYLRFFYGKYLTKIKEMINELDAE